MGTAENIARKLASDHRARRRAREDILLRFRRLSWQDQYKVYEVIQGYFFHSGRGSKTLEETRKRADCVTAVQQVAQHLELPEGETPGVSQYEQARKELGLELSSQTIERRWGSWREVCKAARGERVRMNARQRAQFRAAIQQKMKGEEWLTGIREWLYERGPSAAQDDYDAWARERNDKKPGLPPVAGSTSLREGLALPWSTAVEVAKGNLSLADAQAKEQERVKREDGEFVGLRAIALIFGMSLSRAEYMAQSEGFPTHAFVLNKRRVWLLSDVEAHHAGKPFPLRTAAWLQWQIMTSRDIRRLCGGLTKSELEHALEPSRCGSRIPRPAGHVGGILYWFRIAVEAWLDQAPAA